MRLITVRFDQACISDKRPVHGDGRYDPSANSARILPVWCPGEGQVSYIITLNSADGEVVVRGLSDTLITSEPPFILYYSEVHRVWLRDCPESDSVAGETANYMIINGKSEFLSATLNRLRLLGALTLLAASIGMPAQASVSMRVTATSPISAWTSTPMQSGPFCSRRECRDPANC